MNAETDAVHDEERKQIRKQMDMWTDGRVNRQVRVCMGRMDNWMG